MRTLYEYQFAFNRHRGKRSMHASNLGFHSSVVIYCDAFGLFRVPTHLWQNQHP